MALAKSDASSHKLEPSFDSVNKEGVNVIKEKDHTIGFPANFTSENKGLGPGSDR